MELDLFAAEYKKRRPSATDKEVDFAYKSAQPNLGLADTIGHSFMRGLFGTAKNVGEFGNYLGLDGSGIVDRASEIMADYPESKDLAGKLIWDNPEMLKDPRVWLGGTAEMLPALSAMIAGGSLAGGAATLAGAGQLGVTAAGLAGSLIPGTAVEMGGYYGEHPGERFDTTLYGAGSAALNALPTTRMLNAIGGKYAGKAVVENLMTGGMEAVTEWAEEPLAALIAGEDITQAMKAGVNVMPGAFLSGMAPGAGRAAYDAGKQLIQPGQQPSIDEFLQQNYGMREADLPAMLRPQEEGMQVDIGAETGISASLRPQAPVAPDEMIDSKYTDNLPAMLREQDGAPPDIGMADSAPSVTGQQDPLGPTEQVNPDQHVSRVRTSLNDALGGKALDSLMNTGKVNIVTSAQASKISGEITSQANGKAVAFFNPADGSVNFIADNIPAGATPKQLRGLALHEVGVHAMRLGQNEKSFQSILKQVDFMRQNGNAKMQAAYDRAVKAGTKEADAAHETLAYYVEANPDTTFSQRVMTWLKAIIRKAFPGLKYSPSELTKMASDALKKAATPDIGQVAQSSEKEQIVQPAADVQEQATESQVNEAEKNTLPPNQAVPPVEPLFSKRTKSNGGANQIETEAFKNWFGDSKVVDETGKPLVVYHGTRSDIESFITTKGRTSFGAHFGTAQAANDRLAGLGSLSMERKHGITPPEQIYPTFLSIKNPYEMDDMIHWSPEELAGRVEYDFSANRGVNLKIKKRSFQGGTFYTYEDIVDALKSQGFDGVKYKNTVEGGGEESWIAFDPAQIKSAIGNRGTFDPIDPNILFSRATTGENVGGETDVQPEPNKKGPSMQTEAEKVRARVTEVGGKQTAFERKRGVMTNEESAKLAELTGIPGQILTQKLGDTYNVEELINAATDIRSTWNVGRGQLKAILDRHARGQATATDMAYAQEIVTRMAATGAQFFGVRGEAGRALQIFRTTKDATAKARIMTETVKGIASEQDLVDAITALTAVEEPGKAAEAAAKLYQATTSDKLLEWYYMCLLSGIPTHVVNLVSTGMQGVVQEVDNLVAAGIGAVLRSEDAITFAEIKARAGAIGKGTMLGLKEASRVFMEFENKNFREYGPNKLEGQGKRAIAGFKGKVIRLPMRMLSAEDAFWKATLYTMGMAQEASRLSAKTGIDEAKILANPNREMQDNAWKQATQGTFTEEGGSITKSIQRFRKEHPSLALIIPFVQTPGNIIKTAIRHSPIAPVFMEVRADMKAGGQARDLATARMAVGSSIMTMAYMLAMAGLITGQPPEDPNERRLWYMQGKQPYAVKIGDRWVSFSRLEPFGMLVGGAADFHDILNKVSSDEAETIWAALVSSIAKNLTSKTYLRGISDFINMMTEPERYAETYFQRFISTVMVPTGIAYTAKALDDRRRQVNSLGDAVKSRLPGLRETLPEMLDIKGDPMMEVGSGLYRMVSPAYLSDVKNDKVATELSTYDVSFPAASKKFRGVELSPETHAELVKAMGKPTYLALERIVNSKAYQAMPDEARKYVLQNAVNKLREGARKYWSLQHPEIMREAALLAREKKYGAQK